MTKSELIKKIAEKLKAYNEKPGEGNKPFDEMSNKLKAEKMVDLVLDSITEALVENGKVAISGFGTFEVKERVEKNCLNPRTKEVMTVPGYRAATFKSGRNLKEAVNRS